MLNGEAGHSPFQASFGVGGAPPDMSAGVRDRMWMVVSSWYAELRRGAIVLLWREQKAVGALRMELLGESPKEIVDADGILLVKRR